MRFGTIWVMSLVAVLLPAVSFGAELSLQRAGQYTYTTPTLPRRIIGHGRGTTCTRCDRHPRSEDLAFTGEALLERVYPICGSTNWHVITDAAFGSTDTFTSWDNVVWAKSNGVNSTVWEYYPGYINPELAYWLKEYPREFYRRYSQVWNSDYNLRPEWEETLPYGGTRKHVYDIVEDGKIYCGDGYYDFYVTNMFPIQEFCVLRSAYTDKEETEGGITYGFGKCENSSSNKFKNVSISKVPKPNEISQLYTNVNALQSFIIPVGPSEELNHLIAWNEINAEVDREAIANSPWYTYEPFEPGMESELQHHFSKVPIYQEGVTVCTGAVQLAYPHSYSVIPYLKFTTNVHHSAWRALNLFYDKVYLVPRDVTRDDSGVHLVYTNDMHFVGRDTILSAYQYEDLPMIKSGACDSITTESVSWLSDWCIKSGKNVHLDAMLLYSITVKGKPSETNETKTVNEVILYNPKSEDITLGVGKIDVSFGPDSPSVVEIDHFPLRDSISVAISKARKFGEGEEATYYPTTDTPTMMGGTTETIIGSMSYGEWSELLGLTNETYCIPGPLTDYFFKEGFYQMYSNYVEFDISVKRIGGFIFVTPDFKSTFKE